MTAKDLIEKLTQIPADTLILVSGYEDGYTPAKPCSLEQVFKKDIGEEWWFGEYYIDYTNDHETISAFIIPR